MTALILVATPYVVRPGLTAALRAGPAAGSIPAHGGFQRRDAPAIRRGHDAGTVDAPILTPDETTWSDVRHKTNSPEYPAAAHKIARPLFKIGSGFSQTPSRLVETAFHSHRPATRADAAISSQSRPVRSARPERLERIAAETPGDNGGHGRTAVNFYFARGNRGADVDHRCTVSMTALLAPLFERRPWRSSSSKSGAQNRTARQENSLVAGRLADRASKLLIEKGNAARYPNSPPASAAAAAA